ncbi:MAG: hypothetical protein IJO85_03340 [Lachnospiraceae bacterium]|nr:hypothetical protein [Lachnospiraceae bacterium]
MKRAKYLLLGGMLAGMLIGCGQTEQPTVTEDFVEFEQITPMESEPIIIREEQPSVVESIMEEESTTMTEEEEIVPWVDRVAGEQAVAYSIETQIYEDGIVKLTYPQLSGMQNTELQTKLNENIKQTLLQGSADEGLTAFEYSYEIASMGAGVVSFVFKGYVNYEGSPYPINAIKTLNLNLITGESIRLKDYADVATVVSALETGWGYEVASEGIVKDDFSAFMNNGYVTDYAMTLLDYDVDSKNMAFVPVGFSCIKDNHLVLFIETEHAMGDYVEIIFDEEL